MHTSIYFSVRLDRERERESPPVFLFLLDFENDLLDVRTKFEAQKEDPPLLRNAPPVPGKVDIARVVL